jgi:hypothetical protein
MSTRIQRLALASLLALASAQVWSHELTEGRVRLTLHEGIGRFSLAYLSNTREGAYTPLLVAQDPRTTMLSIVVGNKVYRMGEGSEFAESFEKTATGGRFVWKSSLLTVSEDFSFVSSSASSAADGVRIDLTIRNTSRQDLSVGARYLFDTYLGEASFLHFRTNMLTDVTKELALSGTALPLYWVSPLPNDAEELGLQVMTSGEGISVPDRIVFANWKRLSDASWSYTTSSARNFNLLPYSVNDSAVCQYYEPRMLARGTDMTLTLCLGKYNAAGFALRKPEAPVVVAAVAPKAPEPAPAAPPAVEPPPPPPPSAPPAEDTGLAEAAAAARATQEDLATVNTLLSRINGSIAAGAAVTAADIERLRAAIAELQSRSSKDTPSGGPAASGSTTSGK